MRLLTVLGVSALLVSCDDKGGTIKDTQVPGPDDTFVTPTDIDGDGYTSEEDCDDSNDAVHPGRAEDCNGVDDNCNGVVDEGYADTDTDGIADCEDVEDCDGKDNDGDGLIDEDFADDNKDGEADCLHDEDCNGVDDDGDGVIDEGYDLDGDGYTSCGSDTVDPDCNDKDASINPGQTETDGDGVDNDCNGQIDEGSWRLGDLIITEVMVNPDLVSDPAGEWFELYNTTNKTLTLNGLEIGSTDDGDYHRVTLPEGELLTVAAKSFIVLGTNTDTATNGRAPVSYAYSDISMSNESDDLWIKANGLTIDRVKWDDGATYPDVAGASMSLDPNYFTSTLNDLAEGWCQAITSWDTRTDLGSPGDTNAVCRPIASASVGISSSLYTCDELTLDGSGSIAPEGTSLTYEWELVSAPSASSTTTKDISDTESASPSFIPDEPGTYTFSLTVYNGYEYSAPVTLTVTITERPYNTDPSANAGPDQSYSESAVCWPVSYGAYYTCNECGEAEFELDGTGSSDADGDELTYSWAITKNESYASIEDEDTTTPTVTVSGVGTTYGSSNTVTVEVTLTTTDCMGATDDDIVNLSYTCRGS